MMRIWTMAPALLMLAPVGTARAQGPVAVSASVEMASDYRFRGVSRSAKEPVLQGGVGATSAGGLFAGAWGVLNTDYRDSAGEVDLYAGIRRPVWWLDVSGSVNAYVFPGGTGGSVYELAGTVEAPLGPGLLTLGLNWAPEQRGLARSNRYLWGRVALGIPRTPLTLNAGLGFERGGWVEDRTGATTAKTDYRIGLTAASRNLVFRLDWVGNNLPDKHAGNGRATNGVVASVAASF